MGRHFLWTVVTVMAFGITACGDQCKVVFKECTKDADCCSDNCMIDAMGAGPKSHCAPAGAIN